MKRVLVLLALCASIAVPGAAFGQMGPGMRTPPSPEQRALMDKAHADAKAAAYLALTPAHRERVAAVAAAVAAGTTDRRAAAKLIDDMLAPNEQKAVTDAAVKSCVAMRAAMGAPAPAEAARGIPSAGRYLLMVSMTHDQMRSLMPRARSTSAP
ncbi:MAG TPA: hypothetical protein VIJ64_05085 [Candidatus Lustribacter sp.]